MANVPAADGIGVPLGDSEGYCTQAARSKIEIGIIDSFVGFLMLRALSGGYAHEIPGLEWN